MDDNPYQSPKSMLEIEKPPGNPPKRYFATAFNGFVVCWGVFLIQMSIDSALFDPDKYYTYQGIFSRGFGVPCIFAIQGLLVGAATAVWKCRNPKSTWPAVLAILLAAIPILLYYVFRLFWLG